MDEPFAGVDAATEQAILEVLREMKREGGPSSWYTMTFRRSLHVLDEVILLNMRVVDSGPVADVFHEDNLARRMAVV